MEEYDDTIPEEELRYDLGDFCYIAVGVEGKFNIECERCGYSGPITEDRTTAIARLDDHISFSHADIYRLVMMNPAFSTTVPADLQPRWFTES